MKMIGFPVRTNGAYSSAIVRALIAVHAEHDAVGLHEVVDRGAFLEELRIAARRETETARAARSPRDLRRRSHRHRRLGHDDHLARHVLADRLGHREHVARSAEPSSSGRRPDGDEHDFRVRRSRGDVGRERQPPSRLIALHQLLETRLVDRDDALLQRRRSSPRRCRRRRPGCPSRRRHAPTTSPTYPVPTTQMFTIALRARTAASRAVAVTLAACRR